MKYCFFIIGIISSLFSYSQFPEYEFEEASYMVYPPRQRGIYTYSFVHPKYMTNFDFFDDDGKSNSPVEADVIPYFDSLPDGQYIVFGPKGYKSFKLLKLKKAYSKKDTTSVKITFNVKDGKKNGLARWYGRKGAILMEGNFKDDHKDGVWSVFHDEELIRECNFYQGLREGKDVFYVKGDTLAIAHYKSDVLDGQVKVFYEDRIAMKGMVEDGDEVGKWIFYHPNGNLAKRFTYKDTSGSQILPFLYRSDLTQSYQSKTPFFSLVDKATRAKSKLNQLQLLDSLKIGDHKIYYQYDSPYEGKYEQYSYDGKPADIREYQGGYLTKEPKLYDYSGRLQEEVIVDEKNDSLVYAQHVKYNYYYNYTSRYSYYNRYFEENMYWRNRHLLYSIKHRKASKKELKKGSAKKYTDISYMNAYFDSIVDRDTAVIMDLVIRDDKDTISVKKVHLETGYNYRDGDESIAKVYDKKGRLTSTRAVKYNPDLKKMQVENVSYNKGGNVSWTSYSSYFNNGYHSDSTVLRLNGELYSGKIEYETKKGRKGLAWMEGDVLKVHTQGNKRTGSYVRGRIDGTWTNYDRDGNITRLTNYKRGVKHGLQEIWQTKSLKSKWIKTLAKKYGIEGKETNYLRSSRNFKDGKLDGKAEEFFWNGQKMFIGTYADKKKNGLFATWDIDGNQLKESSFINDTIDGISKRWDRYKNHLTSEIMYSKGKNNGVYKQWDGFGKPVIIGQTKDDYKHENWCNFYSDSILKSETIYDAGDSVVAQKWKDQFQYTLFNHYQDGSLIKNDYEYEYGYDQDYITSYATSGSEPGKYTFYYKTGEVARTGEVKDFVRSGVWKIWDEGGTLIREINYEPGEYIHTRADGSKDTIQHYGSYKSWHSTGNKEVEGYILAEYNNYDCYQEVDISVQDLFYVNFWDDSGNHRVKNGTGYLFLYDRSARPTSEGFLQDGIRHGLWKFRDKDGGLSEIGHFVNGDKHGKWYEGDLIGMHFVDDACFDMSDEEVKEKLEYDKKILNVTIVYYDMGISVNRISYENDTNEEPLERENRRRYRYINTSIIDF